MGIEVKEVLIVTLNENLENIILNNIIGRKISNSCNMIMTLTS